MAKKTKTPTPPQSYFDIAALTGIRNQFGVNYNSTSLGANWIKNIASKLDYLIEQLAINTRKTFYTVYKELPQDNARPQRLKTYVLRGFSTSPKDERIFIKLEIGQLNSVEPQFIIEFDKNRKKKDINPFDEFLNSDDCRNFTYQIPFDSSFPSNWDALVAQITPKIEIMVNELNRINPPGGGANLGEGGKHQNTASQKPNLNTILYGPPGTGKTFHSITYAVATIDGKNPEDLITLSKTEEGRKAIKERYDTLFESGNIAFTTFHQSLGYEDFVEGIKPLEPSIGASLQFDIVDGIFKRICDYAEKCVNNDKTQGNSFEDALEQLEAEWRNNPSMSFELTRDNKSFTLTEFKSKNIPFKKASGGTAHSLSKKTLRDLYLGIRKTYPSGLEIYYKSVLDKLRTYLTAGIDSVETKGSTPCRFVLIIDEINRGNVSQIFGELITLLEPDKRIGEKEEIRLTLPYSNEEFGVPSNVYIIGTMNTADRSVEALDTALRRRFSFVPMLPKPEILTHHPDDINLREMLETLNNRLKVLKDKDHTIGHAWLWNITTIEELRFVFKDKIIPLLQEFFYNDYEKLGLLLGYKFVELDVDANKNLFASFQRGNNLKNQYSNKSVYKITEPTTWDKLAFQSIYQSQVT
jgi:5-methylcytosine-specific restriction protein B